MDTNGRDSYTVTVSGPVSGQVAVGRDISQTQTNLNGAAKELSPEGLSQLASLFATLRSDVTAHALAEQRDEALAKVTELESAIAAEDKPDLVTMDYVRGWFAKRVPQLAGAVVSVIVHPLVGQLVTAAGESLVAEFHRRFH
ncbi:MAG TPA: hypothetical protein VJ851_13490 [Jatrophihabitans sp.]|jgi:hypothetical protein|nr:hypothetical protein [Jatrophihabitans sp.]